MEKMMEQNHEEELELSNEQADRVDEVYDVVFELCKVMTEKPDLEWDMALLGPIADCIAGMIAEYGHRVHFPAVVTEEDGTQYIEEYVEAEENGHGKM